MSTLGDTFAEWNGTTTQAAGTPEPDLGPTTFDAPDEDSPDQHGTSQDGTGTVSLSEALAGQVVTAQDNTPALTTLDQAEARELTDAIRSTVDLTYQLIARAHSGRAWEALGYGSWAEYVQAEFNMSRSRSYQLLDQAKVIGEIESVTPDGTQIHLPESVTRTIKGFLGDITDEIAGRTAGKTPEEASAAVGEIIGEYHDRARENNGSSGDLDEGDASGFYDPGLDGEYDGGHSDGFSGGSGGGNGGGNGGHGAGGGHGEGFGDPSFDPKSFRPSLHDDDEETEAERAEHQRYLRSYDLYHGLSAFKDMPTDREGIKELAELLAEERRDRVSEMIGPVAEWVALFREVWNEQPWAKEFYAARAAEESALASVVGDDDGYDDQE